MDEATFHSCTEPSKISNVALDDSLIIGGKSGITIELETLPFVNLSIEQNKIRLVRFIKLTNNMGRDWHNFECRFEADFIVPKSITVNSLKNGESLYLSDIDISLNYTFLSSLAENVKSKLYVKICWHNKLLLGQTEAYIELFSYDQWLGLQVMPELLCSFVTPNMETISYLGGKVSEELRQETGSGSIVGYPEGREHVYSLCCAAYRAVSSLGIHYITVPASFGVPGQRIRFADNIYKYKQGNCLDLTLLFASLLESFGLHPVLLMQEGHAYVGCHTKDWYFEDSVVEDLQRIRKLVNLDELIVFETTLAAGKATFSEAERCAQVEHLQLDDQFKCAIDVVRSRYEGVRPLPIKRSIDGFELEPVKVLPKELASEQKRRLNGHIEQIEQSEAEYSQGRVERWTQKLLDLSLRNRLLNMRDGRNFIPLISPNIAALEDKLADNEEFSINPAANLCSDPQELKNITLLRNNAIKSELGTLLECEFRAKRLCSLLTANELDKRLLTIYRQARLDMEESGINTLFMVFGVLQWVAKENDANIHKAPILLVPIRLRRLSVSGGFRFARLDEDTIVNETLLELLRNQYKINIPGLHPLPADESGVDVALIFDLFRQAVKDLRGWEVSEEVGLGNFSFGKFVMWNDMSVRLDELKKNQLVSHLISGNGSFNDGIEVFPSNKLEEQLNLSKLYAPLSADSSQLTAILYSQLGKNFILYGPPGTGKSQTITNIIAHNLGLGKRVLFVSEKKAALDVVHKRLSSVGLRPFCLELHSNKASKGEVLAQFEETLHLTDTEKNEDWPLVVGSLEKVCHKLQGYVTILHKCWPNGLSAYDCFAELASIDSKTDINNLLDIDCLTQSKESLLALKELIAELLTVWKNSEQKALQSLTILDNHSWSPGFEREFADSLQNLLELLNEITQECKLLVELFNFDKTPSLLWLGKLVKAIPKIEAAANCPVAMLSGKLSKAQQKVQDFLGNWQKYRKLADYFSSYNIEKLLNLDLAGLKARLEENKANFFAVRFLKNKTLLRELEGLKKLGGQPLSVEELERLIPQVQEYIAFSQNLAHLEAEIKAILGPTWSKDSDCSKLLEQCEKIWDLETELNNLYGNSAATSIWEKLQLILPSLDERQAEILDKFAACWLKFEKSWRSFSDSYAKQLTKTDTLDDLRTILLSLEQNKAFLRQAMRYLAVKAKFDNCHVSAFIEKLEAGNIEADKAEDIFYKAYCDHMLEQIFNQEKTLSDFSGLEHEECIKKFSDLDSQYRKLSQKTIFAKLVAKLPGQHATGLINTELGELRRECAKKSRRKPVRQLLELIPNLAPILKPCFLMSPLSVAQYLPPDTEPFDLVVFDEASQIPVWDAIGVIARGKQLIVVGDPKQMPPTDFFQKKDSSDLDDTAVVEDMESILDECLTAGVHSARLNWHYRSKHEELISFSNHYYYDDSLFTFPSAYNTSDFGVQFNFVSNGIYGENGQRTNEAEAKALVNYIFAKLTTPGVRQRSLGIVTFSLPQKELIEELLEQGRRQHPECEAYFSEQNDEAIFVKNLENVQGDERDVILFSICYAPNAQGRFSMNFGPLNRNGGERRLNVAITRAKEQVVVFSSIYASQIDLTRTRALGASHLKAFLEYAEKKVNMRADLHTASSSENAIEALANFLATQGYKTERNLGNSKYKLDLAVYNPDYKNEYLLGIESDGRAYAAQNTVRDRDELRDDVLKALGWKLCKIWSVDWYLDRQPTCQRLLDLLNKLRQERKSIEIERAKRQIDNSQIESAFNSVAIQSKDNTGTVKTSNVEHEERLILPLADTDTLGNIDNCQETDWGLIKAVPLDPCFPNRREYALCQLSELNVAANSDLYSLDSSFVREYLIRIILVEGPIYKRVLLKRFLSAFNNKLSTTAEQFLTNCLPSGLVQTFFNNESVIWPKGATPDSYRIYRIGTNEETKRPLYDIPLVEVANAMEEIKTSLPTDDEETLNRETLKLFGLKSLTSKAVSYLALAKSFWQERTQN